MNMKTLRRRRVPQTNFIFFPFPLPLFCPPFFALLRDQYEDIFLLDTAYWFAIDMAKLKNGVVLEVLWVEQVVFLQLVCDEKEEMDLT